MSVIPLTLSIGLCLVFTFVVFIVREHARHSFGSAHRDLPLRVENGNRRAVVPVHRDRVAHPPAA